MRATGNQRAYACVAMLCVLPLAGLLAGCQPNASDEAVAQPEMSLAPAPTDAPTHELEYPGAPNAAPSKSPKSAAPSTAAVAGDQPTPETKSPAPAPAPAKSTSTPPSPRTQAPVTSKPVGPPECRPFQVAILRDASARRSQAESNLKVDTKRLENLSTNLTLAVNGKRDLLANSLRDQIAALRANIATNQRIVRSSTKTINEIKQACQTTG